MSEPNILNQARTGDHAAFNILLKPYILPAHRMAYMLLRDRAGAEDAVQEALLRTYKSIHRFDPDIASFKTWFHQILVHVTWKMARRKRFFLSLEDFWIHSKEEGQPEETYLQGEEELELYHCIGKLSLKHRTVIILYYMQELSISEIASVLIVSEGTVKSRLHHARGELKKRLLFLRKDVPLKEEWTWNKN